MAEAEDRPVEPIGSTAERIINLADHPLLLLFAITIGVIALSGLLYYLFVALGWSGPASIIR
jgi:hypothetical protein